LNQIESNRIQRRGRRRRQEPGAEAEAREQRREGAKEGRKGWVCSRRLYGDLAGLLERDLDAADDGDVDEEDGADEGDGDLDGLLARTEIFNRKLRGIRGERAAEGSREGRRGLTPTGLLGAEDVDVGVDLGLGYGADRSGIQQAVMVLHRRSGSHRRRQRVRAWVSTTRRGNRDRGYRPR
jgi:hypothetical protein